MARPRAFVLAALVGAMAAVCCADDASALKLVRTTARAGGMKAPVRVPALRFDDAFDVRHFQRGNLHTHTNRSDGVAAPRDVAMWYRDHGYQFLAITDHDVRIDPSEIKNVEGAGFVLVPGDEITSYAGGVPVHVNALCTQRAIRGARFATREAALTSAVNAVHAQGGVPLINHPNFEWALRASHIARVPGPFLLEVWSGHPRVNTDGNAQHASHLAQWDELLAEGHDIGGVAVDDMHHLRQPPGRRVVSLPGRGWVETFGAETSRAAICQALGDRRFYASSGARLHRIALEGAAFTVWVDDHASVEFVGERGEVLAARRASEAPATADGHAIRYVLRGGESYVRAKITSRAGSAWTQAYRAR